MLAVAFGELFNLDWNDYLPSDILRMYNWILVDSLLWQLLCDLPQQGVGFQLEYTLKCLTEMQNFSHCDF